MIPPWLVTAVASPIAKWVGVAVGVVVVVASIYSKGAAVNEAKHAAEAARQAQAATEQAMRESALAKQALQKQLDVEQQLRQKLARPKKEVAAYVQNETNPCLHSPDFVRVFDNLIRVPNDQHRVPAAPADAGEPQVEAATSAPDTATIAIVQELIERLVANEETWRLFSEFDNKRFESQMQWYKQVYGAEPHD